MKFILVSPKNRTVYNFRGDLIKNIQNKGYEVIVTGPNFEEIDRISELNVKFEQIEINKTGLNFFSDLIYLIKLYKLFIREKPEAILGYTVKPVIYGSIAAKLAGIKNINSMVTGVGYVFTSDTTKAKIIRFLVSILYMIGFKCSTNVIFQNPDDMKEFISRKLVKSTKCKLINGSGVNMDKFELAPYPEEITFLMISRILYSKGVREYLIAAEKVKGKFPMARFILLGSLEKLHDSMSIEDLKRYIDNGVIEYYGETDDVSLYYKQASVYVLPSYREGTPRTVLEAMSMGRAIITTNAPGCRETVIDGETGFLVEVKNPLELEESMVRFIKEPGLVDSMGKASYKLCKEKFEISKVNQNMLKYMNL